MTTLPQPPTEDLPVDPLKVPIPRGQLYITRWLKALQRVQSLEQQLASARADYAETEQQLGEWLLPPNAIQNEWYHVWCGDSMIAASMATFNGKTTYQCSITYQGKDFNKFLL